MNFLKYFVLEFVIIFAISMLAYWLLGRPVDMVQTIVTSVVSAAVLAYALVWYAKKSG